MAPDPEKVREDEIDKLCNNVYLISNELPTSNLLNKGAHMFTTELFWEK
jgi:hypothetical protein